MSGEDVIVSIGVDTSGADVGLGRSAADFNAWAKDAQKALDSTAKAAAKAAVETERAAVKASASAKKAADGLKKQFAALDRDHITLGAPIDEAAEKMAKLRAESEKLERVASLLGPQIGGVVQMMSKLGKVGGSGVGGATAAVAGLGVAFAAALYVGVQFGSMVISTIDNVDELAGSLSDLQRRELAGTIAGMQAAAQAGDDLDASLTELQIRIAGGFSDDVSDLRYAMTGLVDVLNNTSLASDTAAGKFVAFTGTALKHALALAFSLEPLLFAIDKLEQYGGKVRAEYDAARPSMLPEGPYAAGQAPSEQPTVPPFLSPAAGMYPTVQAFKGKKPATGGGGSRGGGSDPLSGFTLDGSGAAFTYGSAADALAATDFTAANSTDAAIQARKEYGFYLDQQIKQTKELAESTNILSDAEVSAAEDAAAARKLAVDMLHQQNQQTTQTTLAVVQSSVGAMGDLFENLADRQGASAREIWEIQHATAIAQGALQIPLAFLQGLASGGPAAPALGAAYAAIAAIEEAAIIATPPPQTRHIGGGVSPDEINAGSLKVLMGEMGGVFSRAAVDRLGGPAGVQQVTRTGTAPMSGGDTYLILDGQRLRARNFGKPTRGFGRAAWR